MAAKVRNLLYRDGRYFARLTVPEKLRSIVGKRELRAPLGSDRRTANKRLPAEIAKMLAVLSDAEIALSGQRLRKNRHWSDPEVAHWLYNYELSEDERMRDEPTDENNSGVAVHNAFYAQERIEALRDIISGEASDEDIQFWLGGTVGILSDLGAISVSPSTPEWRRLARRVIAPVVLEGLQRSLERDHGNYAGFPEHDLLNQKLDEIPPGHAVPISELVEAYLTELARSGRGAAARKRWAPVFADLAKFLKHDDASSITRADLVRWKDDALKRLSAKTVRDVYLGSVRAVLQYGFDNGSLPSNPASGIRVRVTEKARNREKGYTEVEAKRILTYALRYEPRRSEKYGVRETSYVSAAKRWIPWLCAFTGARVAEIAQLRKGDIREDNGVHFLRITPEAGSVKSRQFRDVPIHPQLIEIGFLDFVDTAPDGPLFFDPASKRRSAEHPAVQLSKALSRWIRDTGVGAEGVHPNHGWRHRFKTVARELGADPRVVDAIQGHAPRTAGESYGDVSVAAKKRVISTFPKITIAP